MRGDGLAAPLGRLLRRIWVLEEVLLAFRVRLFDARDVVPGVREVVVFLVVELGHRLGGGLARVIAVDGLVVARTAADRGQAADRLDEVGVDEVSRDRIAGLHRGVGGAVLLQRPLGFVFAQTGGPGHADVPGLALLAVGGPLGLVERVPAGGERRGENLPQRQVRRTILAHRVGLFGQLGDALALQHDRVREGVDAGFGHAHFVGELRRGRAGADTVLDLGRAHRHRVRQRARSLWCGRGHRLQGAWLRRDIVSLGRFRRRLLRLGFFRLWLVVLIRPADGVHRAEFGFGADGGGGRVGIRGFGKEAAQLLVDWEEELLAVLIAEDERGGGGFAVDHVQLAHKSALLFPDVCG